LETRRAYVLIQRVQHDILARTNAAPGATDSELFMSPRRHLASHMSTPTNHFLRVMEQLCAGWLAGDGKQYALPFTPQAHYVVFDGSVLTGPAEIASFHQRAFDGNLRGTELHLALQEIRPVDAAAWLAFTKGGVIRKDGSVRRLTGESVQTFFCKREAGVTLIEAFQNTRIHPVTDRQSADAWRAFDKLWETDH